MLQGTLTQELAFISSESLRFLGSPGTSVNLNLLQLNSPDKLFLKIIFSISMVFETLKSPFQFDSYPATETLGKIYLSLGVAFSS